MKLKLIQLTMLLSMFTIAMPLMSQQRSLEALEQQCEEARERQIAPLRQAAVDECIENRTNNRSSGDVREQCERFYSDFGAAGTTQSGGFRQRMFHNIPECQKFYDAEQAGRKR